MSSSLRSMLSLPLASALLVVSLMSCGGSSNHGPSLSQIPRYPNATQGESLATSSPGGFLGGNLTQLTTTDSFDEVVTFYRSSLSHLNPQVQSFTSELGRQLAVTLPQDGGVISIAIQEFDAEGAVHITLMSVGG